MLSFGKADDILKAPDRPSVLEHHISDFTKLLKGRGKCYPSHIWAAYSLPTHRRVSRPYSDDWASVAA